MLQYSTNLWFISLIIRKLFHFTLSDHLEKFFSVYLNQIHAMIMCTSRLQSPYERYRVRPNKNMPGFGDMLKK